MPDRPFKILGVQHIAIGSRDKRGLHQLWVDLLGLRQVDRYRSEEHNVDEDIVEAGRPPWAVEIDLMEPVEVDARPRVHEPALNHIGLWVDDLPAAYQWLQEQGVRFTPGGIRQGAGGHDICFIHPKGNEDSPVGGQGVLIELVQATAEILELYEEPA